ncbi:hypothetical protein ADU00_23005 [Salmonella enterica subsp. enterica]|nr:hypothetical protein [Salmonella enterica subsp. enterica serovar Hvittingfoss]
MRPDELFYREVACRVSGLQMRGAQRPLREWMRREANPREVMALYREMAVFMEPPQAGDRLRRRIVWRHLYVRFPALLNSLLSLTGAPVMWRQAEEGDPYAGAVLRMLMEEWIRPYLPVAADGRRVLGGGVVMCRDGRGEV